MDKNLPFYYSFSSFQPICHIYKICAVFCCRIYSRHCNLLLTSIVQSSLLILWPNLGQFQGGCHGVSLAVCPHFTILESAGSCRRPTWSSPTLIIIDTTTSCSAFPSVFSTSACRSVLLSAIGHLLLPALDFGTVYLLTSGLPRHIMSHFIKS